MSDAASKDEIQARIAQIKKELAERDSVYDTEKLSKTNLQYTKFMRIMQVHV
jgi:hypothetical protein